MIYASAVALTLIASASATLYTDKPTHQKYMWESFKKDFNREYSTMEEEKTRFAHFIENLRVADLRNSEERRAGGSAVHGITKFSDLSQSEFESRFLTAEVRPRKADAKVMTDVPPLKDGILVDWTGIYTTPVKDQGYCGSCWAFSATEQIESDYMRTQGGSYILSPEQIVQCDKGQVYGCNGGLTESAYEYVITAGGIQEDSTYPYTSYQGTTGVCKVDSSQFVVSVSDYTHVAREEAVMASYVQNTGPLSVCVDAMRWNSYSGGIMSVCGNRVDHCVQAVGVLPIPDSGYWKVRNSWGITWGEAGYIRLQYGQDTCAITNDPTWATVSRRSS